MRAAEPTSPARAHAARRRAAVACLVTPVVSRRAVVAARIRADRAGRAGGRRTGPGSRTISPAPVAGENGRPRSQAAAVAVPVTIWPQAVAPVTTRPPAVAARVMTPVLGGRCRRVPMRARAVAARVMTPVPAGRCRGTTQIRAVVDGAATNLSPIVP